MKDQSVVLLLLGDRGCGLDQVFLSEDFRSDRKNTADDRKNPHLDPGGLYGSKYGGFRYGSGPLQQQRGWKAGKV